jgi:uncharacterized delta-60 repeat protein
MVESEKRMGIVEEIKKQEIKANPDELGKRSVGSGSIGSAASSMLNLLGARVLAFSHLNLMLFLSILFFSLFLLFPSCIFVKKEKEIIDFRTYLAEKQQRVFDLHEEMMKDPQLLEKMYDAFLKTGKMPIIYMEVLTTTIVLGENSLIRPQHIKQVSMDGMIIPKEIDGIKIDIRPGDAFMGTAQSSALTLPEGMTLSIPMPENGKIPIFRVVEKVEELPDGTQKVYTRPATFQDVFKVLIIRNGEAVLTGMKDELGVGDLVPAPEIYSTPETPEEKTSRKIGEFLWEEVFKEELMKKMEEAKKEQGVPDELISRHMKMAHMGFIEEMKNHWKKLSQEERNEFLQALTIIAKEKGIELDISEFFEEEQSTGGQPSPITPKSLYPMNNNSKDPIASYYDWWAKLPLDFDVEAQAFKDNVAIGIFQHKERTPIYREVFRSFPIPPGDTKTPLSAHVGAVFFVKYAIDTYFINIPKLLEDIKEDIMTCGILDDGGNECCIGRWHDARGHGFNFECGRGNNNTCTLGIGNFCLHVPSFQFGECKYVPAECDHFTVEILGFCGRLKICWNPVGSPTISKFPNFSKVGKLLGNFGGLVRELMVEDTMFFGQAAAMVGAVGYLKWDSGNECFSSFKLEDVIFDKKIPISTVEDIGGGAPPFTPIAGYTPIISAECKFDFNLSLRDVICNIGINIDGQIISLCDILKKKKVCTSDNEFIRLLCLNSDYSDFMIKLSYADLLKRIKLSDLFGFDVSFSMRIGGKSKLAEVNLCSLFNRIFKENGIIEEGEDICELVQVMGDKGEQIHRSFSLFDILNFDVCTILPVACGKIKFPDLLAKLNLKDIRFSEEFELTFEELLDEIKKLKINLPAIGISGENELDNSSRALSILGIPVLLRVQTTLQYQVDIEGMGSPKRGFWAVAGVQGGGGHIGAVAARQLADLLKGEMKNPSGGTLTGPGGEKLPSGTKLGQFTMEWDRLLADNLGRDDKSQSALAAVAVVSRCDEWTQFLKARFVTGAGLHPDDAKGIREAFFNEGYYLLAKIGESSDFHVIPNALGSDDFRNIQKYHEAFDSVGLSFGSSSGKVIMLDDQKTKVCVDITQEQQSWGGENDPNSSSNSNNGKIEMKVCEASGDVGSSCSCQNKEPWLTKTFYCSGGCGMSGPGGIVVFEYCGGFRAGQVYRPGILRVKNSFIRLVIVPEASVAVDIIQFVVPILGGPVITVKVQADARAPIILSAELDSKNVDISPNGSHDYGNGLKSTKWKFGGPLYDIGDIPDVMKECTLTGSLTLQADLIVDPKIITKTGGLSADVPLPETKIPILGVDFFDYLPRGLVLSLEKMGVYRVGECKKGRENLKDCSLAGFYQCYEFCDQKDNDKDGIVDNNTGKTFSYLIGIANECPMMLGVLVKYLEREEYYVDEDGDGFGSEPVRYACTWMEQIPPNAVQVGGDCDDKNPQINPIAQEICDCKDNNCNGQIDEGITIYRDCDGDGFGSPASVLTNCCELTKSGCQWVERGGDCDDDNCNVSPIALDIQGDSKDSNCDEQDGMVKVCYLSGDKVVCIDKNQQPPQGTQGGGNSQQQPTPAPKLNPIKKLESIIKKLLSFIFLPQLAQANVPNCDCNYCQENPNANCKVGNGNFRCSDWMNGKCPCTCQLCNRFSNISCNSNGSQVSCSNFAKQCAGGMCSFLVLCPDKDKDGFQDFNKSITIGYYGSGEIQLPDLLKDYTTCSCHDCYDTDPSIPYPGIEVVDGRDNDCSGVVDDVGPKHLTLQCLRPTSVELTWEDKTEGKDYFAIALLKPMAVLRVRVGVIPPSGAGYFVSGGGGNSVQNSTNESNLVQLSQILQDLYKGENVSYTRLDLNSSEFPDDVSEVFCAKYRGKKIVISPDEVWEDVVISKRGNYVYVFKVAKTLYAPKNSGIVKKEVLCEDIEKKLCRGAPQCEIILPYCRKIEKLDGIINVHELFPEEDYFVTIWAENKRGNRSDCSNIVKATTTTNFFDNATKVAAGSIGTCVMRRAVKDWGDTNILYCIGDSSQGQIGGDCSLVSGGAKPIRFMMNVVSFDIGGEYMLPVSGIDSFEAYGHVCAIVEEYPDCSCNLCSSRGSEQKCMLGDEAVNCSIWNKKFGQLCTSQTNTCSCDLCSKDPSKVCKLGSSQISCEAWLKNEGAQCLPVCSCDLCGKEVAQGPEANSCSYCRFGVNNEIMSCDMWVKKQKICDIPLCSCKLCVSKIKPDIMQVSNALSSDLFPVCRYRDVKGQETVISCGKWKGVKECKVNDYPACSCDFCGINTDSYCKDIESGGSNSIISCSSWLESKSCAKSSCGCEFCAAHSDAKCVDQNNREVLCKDWAQISCQVPCSCEFCSSNSDKSCSINGRTMSCKEYASSEDYCTKDIQSCSCRVCKSPDRLCEYKTDPKDPRGEIVTCEKWMVKANPECALSCDCNLCGSNPQAVCKSGDEILYCYEWQSRRGVKCCSCDVCSTGGETVCHYAGRDITCKQWSGQNFCKSSVGAGEPQKIYGVYCWGNNRYGQIGVPPTLNENIIAPVPVTRGEVLAVATGARHTCAVMKVSSTSNGVIHRVMCWGDNSAGQVHPNELTGFIVRPGRVWLDFSDSIKKIVAGGDFTCVLTGSGKVKCWGANNVGQLGRPQSTRGPVEVFSGGMIDVAAGMRHACAVRGSDLTIWCWGENRYGQLGLGYVNDFADSPKSIKNLSGVVRVRAGSRHTCALTQGGAVWCWGDNFWGQLGNGSGNKYSEIPQQVKLDKPVIDLAAGGAHTCAIDVSRNVWCWGSNVAGQIGDYTNIRQNFPVKVKGTEASEYCRYYQTKSEFSCSDSDRNGSIDKVDATCKMRWEKLLVALDNPPLDLSSMPLNATAVRVISEDFSIDIPPAIASLDTLEKVREASIGVLSSLYSPLIHTYLMTYDYEEVSYGNKVASTYPYAIIIDFDDDTSMEPKVEVPRFPEIITLVTPLVAKYYNNLVMVGGADYSAPVTPSQCLTAQLDDCNYSVSQVTSVWLDMDLDGYYGTLITGCVYSYAFPTTNIEPDVLDCKDSDPSIKPGAEEICNRMDDNCNGQSDEGVTTATYYRDNDGDGFGNQTNPITISCYDDPPTGYVSNNADCNDNDQLINPKTVWYKDADGDGYTDGVTYVSCNQPQYYVLSATAGDCNDTDASIYSGAPLNCNNGLDNDCSGNVEKWAYTDQDGDRYAPNSTSSCVDVVSFPGQITAGSELGTNDCNDSDSSINPSVPDNTCNGIDNNCNLYLDDNTAPCFAPTSVQIYSWGLTYVSLRWAYPEPSSNVEKFVIQMSPNGITYVDAAEAPASATNYTVGTYLPSKYYFRVYAKNATGSGSPSSVTYIPIGVNSLFEKFEKTIGGSGDDRAHSIIQSSDGGYVVAGYTGSFGAGNDDFYVVKLDSSGNVEWTKTIGGSAIDYALSIIQSSDGGYVVAGWGFRLGNGAFYVVKLDSSGNVQWTKAIDGANWDQAFSIIQSRDGGYVVAGGTWSFGAGSADMYVVKLDSSGNVEWTKTIGGGSDDEAWSIIQSSDGGYVVAGFTRSFGAGSADMYVVKLDSSGNVEWTKTIGGGAGEEAWSIIQSSDGGYVVAGFTRSFGAGNGDMYVVKLDSSGNVQWTKTIGGSFDDEARSIIQSSDGGYVVAGFTRSFGAGNGDMYVVKLDSSGNVVWTKTIGGSASDGANSIIQSRDGGYVVAGYTASFGTGGDDMYVVKLAPDGTLGCHDSFQSPIIGSGGNEAFQTPSSSYVSPSSSFVSPVSSSPAPTDIALCTFGVTSLFEKTIGGGSGEEANSIIQSRDGGYVVAGYTGSFGAGNDDFYVVKLDSSGNVEWTKTIGGSAIDYALSIIQSSDGGYVVAGWGFRLGNGDFYVVKLDSRGNVQWTKAIDGGSWDQAYSIIQSRDGGYVVAGRTWSFGAGNGDMYVVKLDSSGNVQWTKTIGGSFDDEARSIIQSRDGGYVVAGRTWSFGAGSADMYVVKLDSSGNVVWTKTIGGSASDGANSIIQSRDGGYVVAGYTASFGTGGWDFYVVKLDSSGNVVWRKTIGGGSDDLANSIIQSRDGGYVVAGWTWSFGAGNNDFYVVKLDSSGNVVWTKTIGGSASDGANSIIQSRDGGYVVAGYTASFGTGSADFYVVKLAPDGTLGCHDRFHSPIIGSGGNEAFQTPSSSYVSPSSSFVSPVSSSPAPTDIALCIPTFAERIGGSNNDFAKSIIQSIDGGYAVAGRTRSFGAGGDDIYVVKLNISGNVQWTRTIGGRSWDEAQSIIQSIDGGYVVVGGTSSFGEGGRDIYVVKLDSSGNVQWTRTIGGGSDDLANSIIQSRDGGYVVAGWTSSFGEGGWDIYIVKLDSSGNVEWTETIGGSSDDLANSIIQSRDGGYVVAGWTSSFGAGGSDFYVVKLDSSGNVEWTETIGGGSNDKAHSIIQSSDGGYVVAGGTSSFGASGSHFYVVKLDSLGNVQWTKTIGGGYDEARSIIQSSDGGYVVAGWTSSFGAGGWDMYVVKLDSSGNVQWTETIGGSGNEEAQSIIQSIDGSYVVAGYTSSFGAGSFDMYVVKMTPSGDNICGSQRITSYTVSGGGSLLRPTSRVFPQGPMVTSVSPASGSGGSFSYLCFSAGAPPVPMCLRSGGCDYYQVGSDMQKIEGTMKGVEGEREQNEIKSYRCSAEGECGEGNNNNKDESLASRGYGCSSYGLVMFIPALVVTLIFLFTRRKTFFSLLLLFVLSSFFLSLISCAEGTKFEQLKIQVEKDKLVLGEVVKVTVNSVGGSKGKVKLDMGDGKEIEANIGESVTHTYSGVGLYEIRAYSKDFASDRKMVFVNDPPSISSLQVTDLQGNKVKTVDVDQPFLLVLDCKDITGITKVIIDWGDGVKEEGKSCGIFKYSYREGGQYAINVEVQDEGYGGYFYSLKAEAQYQINVENMGRKLPFVQIDLNTSVGETPLQVTLTIFVNSYDKLTNVEISWGDGKADTLNPTDGVSRGGNFIFTASHTYNETGRYLIQARVKDEKGREGFDFAGVLVSVSDPIISVGYKDTRGKVIEGNSTSFLISDERFVAISGDVNAADDMGFAVVSYVEYRSAGANYIVLQRESFFSNVSYTKSFGSCLLLEDELICSSFGLPITSVTLPVDMSIRAIAVKNSVAIDNIDFFCDSDVCICSDLEGFIPLDVCRNIINNMENDPSASSGQSLSVNLK